VSKNLEALLPSSLSPFFFPFISPSFSSFFSLLPPPGKGSRDQFRRGPGMDGVLNHLFPFFPPFPLPPPFFLIGPEFILPGVSLQNFSSSPPPPPFPPLPPSPSSWEHWPTGFLTGLSGTSCFFFFFFPFWKCQTGRQAPGFLFIFPFFLLPFSVGGAGSRDRVCRRSQLPFSFYLSTNFLASPWLFFFFFFFFPLSPFLFSFFGGLFG